LPAPYADCDPVAPAGCQQLLGTAVFKRDFEQPAATDEAEELILVCAAIGRQHAGHEHTPDFSLQTPVFCDAVHKAPRYVGYQIAEMINMDDLAGSLAAAAATAP